MNENFNKTNKNFSRKYLQYNETGGKQSIQAGKQGITLELLRKSDGNVENVYEQDIRIVIFCLCSDP